MSVQYKKIFLFKIHPVKTSLNILCSVASKVGLKIFSWKGASGLLSHEKTN